MDFSFQTFWEPKLGSIPSEYEDACFPRKPRRWQIRDKPIRFAIADGATEASFSRTWARLLVTSFVRERIGRRNDLGITGEDLRPIRQKWRNSIRQENLPWYAQHKVDQGAAASLLFVELATQRINGEPMTYWHAVAVGDSCLIHIRENTIKSSFPLRDSKAFTNSPPLLSSVYEPLSTNDSFEHSPPSECLPSDALFLMTDALSCWFFKEAEADRQPWNRLRELDTGSNQSFRQFIASLRERQEIRNDDVTLARIDLL